MTKKRLDKILIYNKYILHYITKYQNKAAVYKSPGLEIHIEKRHPECLPYINSLSEIINSPDYIGINPNEKTSSFELVKTIDKNIQVGIKLDIKDNYFYVATLHTITDSKLKHRIESGRLKRVEKYFDTYA